MIPTYQHEKYFGRVLSSSEVYEIQELQVHLQTIVDICNSKNSNQTEEIVNYICNSLDDGLNTLFKIRHKLTGV